MELSLQDVDHILIPCMRRATNPHEVTPQVEFRLRMIHDNLPSIDVPNVTGICIFMNCSYLYGDLVGTLNIPVSSIWEYTTQ